MAISALHKPACLTTCAPHVRHQTGPSLRVMASHARPASSSALARRSSVRCSTGSESGESEALSRREALGVAIAATVFAQAPAAEAGTKSGVYWLEPKNGDTVTSPVTVRMGVKGLEVSPVAAGPVENSGHHHIIVDGGPVKAGDTIPFDETHIHFGKGQTKAEIELPPGKHKLTLQFANVRHESYGKNYANSVNITVN